MHDLVDEFWLKIFPLTLGSGKRLFVDGTIPAAFKLTESKVSPNAIIIVNYERAGAITRENSVPDFEHGLDFRSLDDAVAYARRCLSAGYDRTGNWDLAQTCRHLTDWLRAPLEGPPPMPWLMRLPMAIIRLTLGPRILKQFLGNRRLPVGMGTIDATVHPPESNANAAVAAFAAMVAQFNSHTGPLMRPSPLFNRLEREQTLDLQIVHCMHHFGRLKPHSGIVADTTENLAQ